MRAGVPGFGVDLLRLALEILPRWKPRGLDGSYGESIVGIVPVDAICGDREWLSNPGRMGCGVVFQN